MPAYQDISKYPETRRDLALVAEKAISSGEVMSLVRDAAGSLMTSLTCLTSTRAQVCPKVRKVLRLV